MLWLSTVPPLDEDYFDLDAYLADKEDGKLNLKGE